MEKITKKLKEKQNIKNISLMLGIIIIILLMLIGVRTQSSRNGKLSANINSSKIIQIKLIGNEPQNSIESTFWMEMGNVNFYPKASSVYGKEIDDLNYAVDLKHGEVIQKDDEHLNRHIGVSSTHIKYYEWMYQNYLGIFDKVKVLKMRLLFGARTIILNSKELKKIYPFPQKGQVNWYYDAINLVSDPMVSLKITLDIQGRPIMVSASAKSKPNYYRKLYILSYSNDVVAYNWGFNKILESIKNTPEPPEPMDD